MATVAEKIEYIDAHWREIHESRDIPYIVRIATPADVVEIERRLDVALPNDFKQIAVLLHGNLFSLRLQLSLVAQNSPWDVAGRTLEYREAFGLPDRFVLLSDDNEFFVVMETQKYTFSDTPIFVYYETATDILASTGSLPNPLDAYGGRLRVTRSQCPFTV